MTVMYCCPKDGDFNHQGEQLLMKPSLRRKRSVDDNSHILTKMALPAPKVIEYEHGDPAMMGHRQG